MVMYIITLALNSTFETIDKATGFKMTAKAAGKNSSFPVSVKNNLNMRLTQRRTSAKFWVGIRGRSWAISFRRQWVKRN